MDDFLTWLGAQFDADEAEISRHPVDGHVSLLDDDPGYVATTEANYPCDPLLTVGKTFALAEVDSKRRLVSEILRYEAKIDSEWGCCHTAEQIAAGKCSTKPSEVPALQMVALPYAGRAGYRGEWRSEL